jgi:RNA polymerase sigma-70 factor (ECF subfamily)
MESARLPEAIPDEEVVARVRAGETGLFELLLRRYNQRLYRAARSVLRDDLEAEDVVQEAWVRAFLHLDQFAGRARFSTWVTRIALHEAFARGRRSRRHLPIGPAPGDGAGEREPESPDHDPEARAAGVELARNLRAAIDGLPGGYRSVFVLREIEGLSTAETAACLNLSPELVKTRLHRARAILRAELSLLSKDHTGALRFLGRRCDAMVARVFARLGIPAPGTDFLLPAG